MKGIRPLMRRVIVQVRLSLTELRKRRLAVLGLPGALLRVIFYATITDIEAQATDSPLDVHRAGAFR